MSEIERLREPPQERFSGAEHFFDLEEAFERLPLESTDQHGVMGKALYRHRACTTAIFAFKAGAVLKRHVVEGEAILQVLEGRLRVRTGGEGEAGGEHVIGPNQILLLAPGVEHDIRAEAETQALMHVVLSERTGAR